MDTRMKKAASTSQQPESGFDDAFIEAYLDTLTANQIAHLIRIAGEHLERRPERRKAS